MKHSTILITAVVAGLLATSPAALAKWPPARRVSKDVKAYWEKTWPDQQVEYVKMKSDCEKTEIELQTRAGKTRKCKACSVQVDVYVARGYRYFIYRDSTVTYVRRKLHGVQQGELHKAWKEGGVPAPAEQEVVALLEPLAREKLEASRVDIRIDEMGKPRPHGDVYRLTLVLDIGYTREGTAHKKEKVYATLQSDGTTWEPVAGLAF